MQALKGFVVGMAVLIVIAMGVMGYGIYRKAGDPGFSFFSVTPAPAPAAAPAPTPALKPFGELAVPVPAGCTIARVVPDGNRLYLQIGPEGPCTRVVVVDLASGSVLGTVTVRP